MAAERRTDRRAAAAVPGQKRGEARAGGLRGASGRAAQILMRCAVSMATLSEEGKKKRVLSLATPHPPTRPSAPSSVPRPSCGSCCPPPQLARLFVRRQMIPQMPRPSRPFQLHSPASPRVRGHHRASEWVSVATVANGGGESGRGLLTHFFSFLSFLFFYFVFALSWLQSLTEQAVETKYKYFGTVLQ